MKLSWKNDEASTEFKLSQEKEKGMWIGAAAASAHHVFMLALFSLAAAILYLLINNINITVACIMQRLRRWYIHLGFAVHYHGM